MEKQEVDKRFNNLPIEHRTTIIGNELITEIQWLKQEKTLYKKQYVENCNRMNKKIKILELNLKELKD